jgi:hypothetical protein
LGLGTNLADVDDSSSISGTRKRKNTGSLKQLGQLKRQKSTPTGLGVETSPYYVEGLVVHYTPMCNYIN